MDYERGYTDTKNVVHGSFHSFIHSKWRTFVCYFIPLNRNKSGKKKSADSLDWIMDYATLHSSMMRWVSGVSVMINLFIFCVLCIWWLMLFITTALAHLYLVAIFCTHTIKNAYVHLWHHFNVRQFIKFALLMYMCVVIMPLFAMCKTIPIHLTTFYEFS